MLKGERSYILLKNALRRKGLLPYEYLAKVMGMKYGTVTDRMMGRSPWRMDEMYKLLRLIDQPKERLYMFFPETDIKKPPAETDGKCGKTA